ncbi:ParB N-terminal domain-containing protein [Streptomyces sp. NPDC101209]|uniref:ParB/RepB/Spo0J family partition protein n=1 Tax=Streptomyces sp. NPDC101209 TaxID=3366129 RepID=UPI0038009C72
MERETRDDPDGRGTRDLPDAEAAPDGADHLIRLRDRGFEDRPVELVPIERLVVDFDDFSPRSDGEDEDYVRTLAETEAEFPPILVHRATMTVVDGAHRLRAACLRGADHITARFFEGDLATARLLAVATNVTHGRPLSTDDRIAAARRILAAHPSWADRAVAALAGLSAKAVARLRDGTGLEAGAFRIGRDGRSRPVDASQRRELAGELIRSDPGASLRQIAARAGLAPATVADVRARIRRGESPVPDRGRDRAAGRAREPVPPGQRRVPPASTGQPLADDEVLRLFDALRRDPSLRFSDAGRSVLRVLDACAVIARDGGRIAATVPPHCRESLAQLAHGYAGIWNRLAHDLTGGESERIASLGA